MLAKFKSALTHLGGADAMVLQSIVGGELAQGHYVGPERDSNLQPSGRKTLNLPLSHHAPRLSHYAPPQVLL